MYMCAVCLAENKIYCSIAETVQLLPMHFNVPLWMYIRRARKDIVFSCDQKSVDVDGFQYCVYSRRSNFQFTYR